MSKSFKSRLQEPQVEMSNKNYWDDETLWEKVESEIDKFIARNGSKCETCKQQGWLGDRIKKSHRGLLGYLRTSFALQIKILEGLDNPIPIYHNEFLEFFKSTFFKDAVLKNGIVQEFYKREHLEVIRANNL